MIFKNITHTHYGGCVPGANIKLEELNDIIIFCVPFKDQSLGANIAKWFGSFRACIYDRQPSLRSWSIPYQKIALFTTFTFPIILCVLGGNNINNYLKIENFSCRC